MSQFYVRVSKENQVTGEHAGDDKAKAQAVFDELKTTAPDGSKIAFHDFSKPISLIDSHVVKKVS